jgi:hypothetical protein
MIKVRSQAICRSRWFTPAICLGLGIVMFAVSWLGGSLGAGIISLAILGGFGLVLLLLTNRSETVRGLTVGRDERFAQLDLRATALAGMVVLLAALVAWLVATARGQSGSPYGWLLTIGGLAYLFAFAFFRWRG